ncbi:MAG: class I SAM-dependent methyltransferase [Balneolaceae bacterium]|nr:class I SAM-dependent methyltransferase [Balneolaceae bacterium]
MNTCCQITDQHFDAARAREDLERYRSDGPDSTTRVLLTMMEDAGAVITSHLDVGGGIGVLALELLERKAARSTIVEASSANIEAARSAAEEKGCLDRITFVHGDAAEIGDQLPRADLVTLDRVICCYPDADSLIRSSAAKASTWYAASYPRDRWYVRLGIGFENLVRRLRGNPFRTFVHDPGLIHDRISEAGFTLHSRKRTFIWEMVLYHRESD